MFLELFDFELFFHRWKKKIAQKIYNFFFRTPKLQNKKIRNKQNFE